jgi:hypothetical protein
MRHAAASDRLTFRDLAQRDQVAGSWRAQEDHLPAFPEPDLEAERLLVELERALDVAHVQVEVIQSVRFDHCLTWGISSVLM